MLNSYVRRQPLPPHGFLTRLIDVHRPSEEGMDTGFRRYDGTLVQLVAQIFSAYNSYGEGEEARIALLHFGTRSPVMRITAVF